MLKKTITYTDFNDVEHTEDFFFNLNKSELTELALSVKGGMADRLAEIMAEENSGEMLAFMKKLILSSVGVKSPDGKLFLKDGAAANFVASPAFDILFMEIATDATKVADFMTGVIPTEFREEFRKEFDTKVQAGLKAVPSAEDTASGLTATEV